jgi:hypothetical protein
LNRTGRPPFGLRHGPVDYGPAALRRPSASGSLHGGEFPLVGLQIRFRQILLPDRTGVRICKHQRVTILDQHCAVLRGFHSQMRCGTATTCKILRRFVLVPGFSPPLQTLSRRDVAEGETTVAELLSGPMVPLALNRAALIPCYIPFRRGHDTIRRIADWCERERTIGNEIGRDCLSSSAPQSNGETACGYQSPRGLTDIADSPSTRTGHKSSVPRGRPASLINRS